MKIRENSALCFDDVLLVPQYFDGKSRKDIDLSTTIAGIKLRVPFICANMSFCETYVCLELDRLGAMGVVHRNNDPSEQYHIVNDILDKEPCAKFGIAVGLSDWESRLKHLYKIIEHNFKNILIVLDVAHADQKQYWETVKQIKDLYPDIHLCIGTFGHKPKEFDKYRGDSNICWRTGVGSGNVCSTRIATGCGMPTFQAILELGHPSGGIVADGGIKNSGDVVKSLSVGASACMMGRMFAGSQEGVGPKIKDDRTGKTYKTYVGNASAAGKRSSGLFEGYIEGVESLVEYSGPISETVRRLEEGVRSGFSYCGALNLKELQEKAEFVKISGAGMKESLPHGIL